jgi:hypothetical protein
VKTVRVRKAAWATPAALVWLFGGVVLAFFLYLIVTVGRIDAGVPEHDAVAICIEKYRVTTQATKVDVGGLYDLNGFCYNSIGTQLMIDQEKIRRDNFVFQRNENVVLLYMVVLITISGVVLAGVQLLASYKLALAGHGELAGGGSEINYSASSVSFKSSVIGLTILAMSFAFFLVFVIYVYELREISSPATPAAQTSVPAPPAPPAPPNLTPAELQSAAQPAAPTSEVQPPR